jgi:uncharacterized protein (TIGR02246 family)
MQTLIPAACLVVFTAAQPAVQVRMDWSQTAERQTDLAAVRSEYISAVNAGDPQRAAATYASDALAVLGDAEVLRGAAAIGERLRQRLAADGGTVTLAPRSFTASGPVGSETGTYTVRTASGVATGEGVYVAVYSQGADGRWRIAMEVRTGNGRW